MQRLRFVDIRLSSLPDTIGLCTSDGARVAAAVNEAQERLITDPMAPDEGWWGGWGRMLFNAQVSSQGAYIVTPANIARVILMNVCDQPIHLRNGFYEFLEFGIGLQPRRCTEGTSCNVAPGQLTQAYERDTVCTLGTFLTTPQQIAVYPSSAIDVGKRVLLQGTDQNGITVYSDTPTGPPEVGEWVTLTTPFVLSVNQFSALTGIQKESTMDRVTFYMVDPITSAETLLSTMEPTETVASYRRYFLNGLPNNCCNTAAGLVQVTAQVKFDYQPVVNDSDWLTIQSIPALIEECKSNRYGRIDTAEAGKLEAKCHGRALAILNGQLDHFLGKIQTAVRVPLFGSNPVILQPK